MNASEGDVHSLAIQLRPDASIAGVVLDGSQLMCPDGYAVSVVGDANGFLIASIPVFVKRIETVVVDADPPAKIPALDEDERARAERLALQQARLNRWMHNDA